MIEQFFNDDYVKRYSRVSSSVINMKYDVSLPHGVKLNCRLDHASFRVNLRIWQMLFTIYSSNVPIDPG